MTLPTLITLTACLTVCGRLMTYRRGSARFRRHISVTAWLLIAANGAIVLRILLGADVACPVGWGMAMLTSVLAVLVCRAQGNVAELIRIPSW